MTEKRHGGKRQGAGAKKKTPEGATRRTLLLTDLEYEKVLELIKSLRK